MFFFSLNKSKNHMSLTYIEVTLKFFFSCCQYYKAPAGSHEKLEAQKQLHEEISLRKHMDYSINHIGELLFGNGSSSKVLETVRPSGQPIVDDWNRFKMLVGPYFLLSCVDKCLAS